MSRTRAWFWADRIWWQLFLANLVVVAALKFASFQNVLTLANRLADLTRAKQSVDRTDFIEKTRRYTHKIERHGPVRGRCLSRSIGLYTVLRRYGIDCTIQIGTRRGKAEFAAHAWVEINEGPVNESSNVRQHYAVFDRSFGD